MTRTLPFDTRRLLVRLTFMAVVAVAFALSSVRWPLPFASDIKPAFVLIVLFYGWIFWPRIAGTLTSFAAGLLVDLLTPTPLGLHAFSFLMLLAVVSYQRRFLSAQSVLVLSLVFFMAALFQGGVVWLGVSLAGNDFAPMIPILLHCVLSALLFPVALGGLVLLTRAINNLSV